MSDTLRGFVEAMNRLPDNQTRLIDPQRLREAELSFIPDRGQANGDPAQSPWVVPIPAIDTWVDIPIAIGGAAAMVLGDALFWRLDANGHLVYDYVADWPSTIVPAGYTRTVSLLGVVEFDPNGDTWELAFTIGGVTQLPTYTIETAGQTDSISATLISGDPVDVSVAPPVSLSVRNRSGAADFNMTLAAMRVFGGVRP